MTTEGPICQYCGGSWHAGLCPRIKSIGYDSTGLIITRVEFVDPPTWNRIWLMRGAIRVLNKTLHIAETIRDMTGTKEFDFVIETIRTNMHDVRHL